MVRIKTFPLGLSLWLDITRLGCSIVVVIFHSTAPQIGAPYSVGTLGVDAVMVFFVLSGFVISFVSEGKESDPTTFACARLARLWSILIPALVLTPIFDAVGLLIDRAPYTGWGAWIDPQGSIFSLIPSAFFVNELWWSRIPPLSNGPVWSICFEAWYYAMFAIAIFTRGKVRYALLIVATLIAGPRILLLFPVWLLGVATYQIGKRWQPSTAIAIALFAIPIVALPLAEILHVHRYLTVIGQRLLGSKETWLYTEIFLWWYFAGLGIAAHFLGAWKISAFLEKAFDPFSRVIAAGASLTLSIYLFHFPLLLLSSAIFSGLSGPTRIVAILISTFGGCIFLGAIFEPQRYRLRRILEMAARSLSAYFPKAARSPDSGAGT